MLYYSYAFPWDQVAPTVWRPPVSSTLKLTARIVAILKVSQPPPWQTPTANRPERGLKLWHSFHKKGLKKFVWPVSKNRTIAAVVLMYTKKWGEFKFKFNFKCIRDTDLMFVLQQFIFPFNHSKHMSLYQKRFPLYRSLIITLSISSNSEGSGPYLSCEKWHMPLYLLSCGVLFFSPCNSFYLALHLYWQYATMPP